jgi:tetratricopeptide (TPR) repeat protein
MTVNNTPISEETNEHFPSARPSSENSIATPDRETPKTVAPKSTDERTIEITPPIPSGGNTETGAGMTREEQDRRLAAELAKRGVSPEEIARLLALGRKETPSPTAEAASAHDAIAAQSSPPLSEPYVPKPTITLPPFRESSPEEKEKADRLLVFANVARRRGQFQEAEKACREAIELTPSDAAALELYGDILQACGRVDDALYAYEQAKKADPRRASAEKKYAELMLMQDREVELLRQEYIPRNPKIAVLFTALFPGGGQLYNGEPTKGFLIAVSMLILVILLGWTPLGFPGLGAQGITWSFVLFTLLALGVYIYAVIDANIGAGRNGRPRSGWEV